MFAGIEQRACIPSGTGAGYTLPTGLASLASVQDHVSIVTGLQIPGTGPSGVTPPGGSTNPWHTNVMKPALTGFRSTDDDYGLPHSPTADQLVADVVGTDTHFRSLEYRMQPVGYRGGSSGTPATMSFAADGSARVPQTSPQLAYEALFAGFTPSDPADVVAKQKLLERRLSVLDLVRDRGDALVSRVSKYDRQRLEQHFDQIRDLERRLADIPNTGGAGCSQLPDPGPDPQQENFMNTAHGGTAGYSGENERGAVLVDLIHMALVCDLTRVATLMLTIEQSMMSIEPLFGASFEMHDLTHEDFPNKDQIWDEVTSWHAGFMAALVQKLADTPEPTGGTLLDSTVVVLTNSGGQGSHGGANMALVVAGCPSVLRMGEHIVASGGHPSNVYQTAMLGLGIDQNLGEVPGIVDGLLV